MKKKLILIFLIMGTISIIAGCSSSKVEEEINNELSVMASKEVDKEEKIESQENEVIENIDIEIKDDTFITQMDAVFDALNACVGMTMKVEGLVMNVEENKFAITRYYDMIHDNHTHEVTVGINANYNGEIPDEDTWVEAVGVIKRGYIDGREQPVLEITSLESKFTPGKIKVIN